jgi:TetR/AcrR family transcriptional repressor of mexJK operon
VPSVPRARPKSRKPQVAQNRPRTDRGEQRRLALLNAAREVFLEVGYERASIEEVMRRVGGSKASLYSYFGSKERLFWETVIDLCDHFIGDLAVPAEADSNLRPTLTTIGQRFLTMSLSPLATEVNRIVTAEAPRFPDLARRFYDHGPKRAYTTLGRYLSLQAKAGRLVCDEPNRAAAQFFELVASLPHKRLSLGLQPFPAGDSRERHLASAVDVFLSGYLAGGKR